jgi:amino acid adenylation domain-containing protein
MELVTDHPRTRVRAANHASVAVPVPGRGTDRAELLAAFAVLLHRYTAEPELCIELDAAGYRRGRVRLRVEPSTSFGSLLARVNTLASAGDSDPDESTGPAFTDHDPAPDGPELALVVPGLEPARLSYDSALFDRATAERMAEQLGRILRADPATPVAEIELMDAAEQALVRDGFNDTGREYPRDATIHQLFAAQVRATPHAPAVSHRSGELSYAELDARAEQLADRLRAAGVRAGEPVGLLMPRSPWMVAAALAILRAGACYLPIDVDYPPERIGFQLTDSGATALIVDADTAIDFAGPVLMADSSSPAHSTGASVDEPVVGATDTAYLMYTSGTTGRPKGVQVRHRGVVRLVRNTDYLSFGPDTRMLAISSICFDASTFELWGPLLNGGSVHLAGPDVALDATELGRLLVERSISTLLLIAPVFNHLVEQDPTVFRPLRELMVGGDALSARHLRAVLAACPELVLINGYGPTENTTLASTHRIGRDDLERIPIGRPVANSTAYVLDPAGRLCPIGVPGELCVGGDGVAGGYLNRPELTAAAFPADPFRGRGEGTLFRTGDIARWRPDGVLEFFGRRDRQVKVRGFRIELGEIEHALREHPAVREAVVLDRPRPGAVDRVLAAYHVADRALSTGELRAHLADRLPAHMLPAAFVQLPTMPLNSSGKIDLDRLPAPTGYLGGPDSPRSIEGSPDRTLLELVRGALGLPAGQLGPDDDLRDLGIDSFSTAMLSARIAGELGVRVPASMLLRAGTVRRIAELLSCAPRAVEPVVPRVTEAADYPVSPQQRRLYVEQLKNPAAVHYNVPVLVRLPVELATDRLTTVLAQLAERHEALRTEFVLHGGELRQRIRPAVNPQVTELAGLVGDHRSLPFDLEQAPLWRVSAAAPADGATTLLLDLHHIVTDGVSLAVLVEDLLALATGRQLPAPTGLRYRDYACWLAGPDGTAWRAGQRGHWRQVFAGPRRRPDLPLDEPRPAIRAVDGGELAFRIERECTAGLRELARQAEVTLFAVLATGYAVLLAGLTGEPDVTIGTPMSGRTLAGLERTVGILATTVCLRVAARPELSFHELVRVVGRAAEAATGYQDFPLEELAAEVEPGRDYRRHPLFDALIAVHSSRYLTVADHAVALRPLWNGQSPFDLNLQLYEEPDGLRASLQYGTRILRRSTVEGWRDRLLELLNRVVADPSLPVAALIAVGRTVPDLEFDL